MEMLRSRILWRLLGSHLAVVLAVLGAWTLTQWPTAGSETVLALVAASGVGVAASLLAAAWSACRVCGPVARLTDAARTWSPSPVNPPVPIHSSDELGTLTAAFNAMGQSIADAIAMLARGEIDTLPLITKRAKLADGPQAVALARAPDQVTVLIEP